MSGPRCGGCGGARFDSDGECLACGDCLTLGYQVVQWVQSFCVVPDREDAGQPFIPTVEQGMVFVNHYRVRPDAVFDGKRWRGSWVYDRGTQLRRPQKWGKAPISSAWVCVEAAPDGPVLFDGWDAQGQPVGRPWPTPHVQVTACSEDQTDNIWRALLPMIQLGPLAEVFPDAGLTRINLPTGGLIEPVTAAAISRLGQRVTAVAQDQTESWVASNGGHKLADNQRRGLAGTGGRFFETPNAHDPVERSVAQLTAEGSAPGVYKDHAEPKSGSVRNKQERRKVLVSVYGDSTIEKGGWIDLDRIDSEIESLLEHDPAQAERWFMNRCLASEGAAFDIEAWTKTAAAKRVAQHNVITIGVDGAHHDDAIAVVATDVKSGYQWPLIILERPLGAGEDYAHDMEQVDQAVDEAFGYFNVWRLYADTQWIQSLVERWQNRYGEKRVIEWLTYRPRQIAWAVRNYEEAISRGDVPHHPDEVFTAHIRQSRKRMLTVLDDKERPMHTLCKDTHRSPRKIDAAMAAVLSWEARSDCISAGGQWMGDESAPAPDVPKPPAAWAPGRALDFSNQLVPSGPVGPMGDMS